ncbi:MAG: hypothetical protein ACKVQJ_14555 [Pyrinomonadaceae bacterium]
MTWRNFYFVLLFGLTITCLPPEAAGQTHPKRIRKPAVTARPTAIVIAESGTIEGMLYGNKELAFTFLIPGTWHYYSGVQNKAALDSGRQTAKISQVNLSKPEQEALDASIANTQILFQATPFPLGDPKNTALLSCGIERLQAATTKEKYAAANKKLVLLTPNSKITKDVYAVTFGGVSFTGFDVEGSAAGKTYRQNYLVTVRNGVALFFVTTLQDEKYDQMLDYSLKTIKFMR